MDLLVHEQGRRPVQVELQLPLSQLTLRQRKTVHAGLDIPLRLNAGWGKDVTLAVCLEVFLAFDGVGLFVGL